jgi:HrpA-like RNA helicase
LVPDKNPADLLNQALAPPKLQAIEVTMATLRELGALDAHTELTALGMNECTRSLQGNYDVLD